MGRAAMNVVFTGFVEAELAVHRQAHIGGVIVLLAVVLPPADRAERQGAGFFQRLISAARAAKSIFHGISRMNGRITGMAGLHQKQLSVFSYQFHSLQNRRQSFLELPEEKQLLTEQSRD
jgi:hypothetical protein